MSWRGEDGQFRKGTPQERVSAHVEKVNARHPDGTLYGNTPRVYEGGGGGGVAQPQFPQAAISKPKPSPEPHWPSALIWLIALAGLALIGLIVYIAH